MFMNYSKSTIYSWRGCTGSRTVLDLPPIARKNVCKGSRTVLNLLSIAGEDVTVHELFSTSHMWLERCRGSTTVLNLPSIVEEDVKYIFKKCIKPTICI